MTTAKYFVDILILLPHIRCIFISIDIGSKVGVRPLITLTNVFIVFGG